MAETLNGLIERVTYHNPENGFAVLKVTVKGRQDLVTVVGSTTSVTAGEHLEASGRRVVDRDHGQQSKADELKTTHPASAEGIEEYLASGAIRSIGPKLGAKIVGIYKERTLDVFEKTPDFLLHIKGIGPERLRRIRQSWQEQKEVRKIMLFLAEHGISSGRAVNDYDKDVFNGDLGIVEKINRIEQTMVVNFEGREVEYDFGDLDELALAYVLSIHKSQGSGFACVVIPVHTQHYMMLQRNLLYTAVTRGKRLVVLVGTKKALGMAVRRQDTGRRYTALRERLQVA